MARAASGVVAPTSFGFLTSGRPFAVTRQMRPCVVVAARVAEIDLAVLDDRVVPVGDVDRPVRAPSSRRSAGTPGGCVLMTSGISASCVAGCRRRASSKRQTRWPRKSLVMQVALPVVRQVPAADDLQAAVLRAAGVQAVEDARRARRR